MSRAVAMAFAVLAVAAACGTNETDGAGPASAISTSTTPLTSASTGLSLLAEQAEPPATTAPDTPAAAGHEGRSADDVFVTPTAAAISYVALDEATRARLDARFRQDERIDAVLTGVSARGVQRGDQLAGVVVAVAVSPEVAGDAAFQEAFRVEATRDARVESRPLMVGDQSLVAYETRSGLASMLWRYDNLFVLISGRDLQHVRDVATVLVNTLVGPVEVENDLDGDGLAESDLTGDGVPDVDSDGDGAADAAPASSTTGPP
jgi:hypothetical protein